MAMQETRYDDCSTIFSLRRRSCRLLLYSMMVKTSQGVLKRGALLDKDGTLCKV